MVQLLYLNLYTDQFLISNGLFKQFDPIQITLIINLDDTVTIL